MGLQGFARFEHALQARAYAQGVWAERLGRRRHPPVVPPQAARGFRTLEVDGFSPKSVIGYKAFFQCS